MKKRVAILWLIIIICLLLTTNVIARQGTKLKIPTGQSQLLKINGLKRVAITEPEIADVIAISTDQLLVNGKQVGETTLHIWDKQGHKVYQLQVIKDEQNIINKVEKLISIDTVKVAKVDQSIILTGQVKNQNQLQRAKEIASVFGEEVVNHLVVQNPQQILLEAQVFEISKTSSDDLGFDWYSVDGTGANLGSGTALLGERLYHKDANDNIIRNSTPRFGLGYSERLSELRVKLKALVQSGDATLLAKPKLVAKSGKEAKFATGGEIPIVTTNNSGEQTVIWKQYGVQFKIKPTVTKNGRLKAYLNPKVSRLDWANAVEYGNGRLPAIKSSEVATEVVIDDEATLAIGGLIQQYKSREVNKVPLLGDLPILGALFRSKSFKEGKSELVILVTPKIIDSSLKSKEAIGLDSTFNKKEKLEKKVKHKAEGKGKAEE
ncbi:MULTISPECIES: type II and III secretion system protein family protein [unclassified Candidatus Frackibacter]|uniref:type II and III secretion system protein family protein n=1 Tax=unclassified Candidatus Frackibacter TaxID=2648818 RepID=UPI0008809340|nr:MULTISPECIES: pilus assembly protein N-terminal domain-containing protein [unclassified Candidatus Frackibacter]SDC72237.1 pilus assembly protein CpaC [Candidatus Frackibacter sp. WG11]SEM86526.1 pilus assembly protein CpaC [Candidatus Frackibacter sp. WG12]SFL95576.1 pilus assembly protein CpaC [Candidatus Frackibacter sp. WG13]